MSRKPAFSSASAAFCTSGVSCRAWFTWVWSASCVPRSKAFFASRVSPSSDLRLEEVLRQPHEALRGQPDVPDVLDVQQLRDEALERLDGQVGHVAAGDDHVADARGAAEVVEDLLVALRLRSAKRCFSTCGTSLPTRSMRVQWPQYWGQVESISASTLVG
jgi:hypothetical protein